MNANGLAKIHAALIGEETHMESPYCNRCITGGRNPIAKQYELKKAENGLLNSVKNKMAGYMPSERFRIMRFIEYGTANEKTILLLHGGGLSWWNYRSEAELLQDRYHVVLPILDGHADSDADFVSIPINAERIRNWIGENCGGKVFLLGGLSLGAQIAAEILAQDGNICEYAILESASVIPSALTEALIGPSFSSSYSLIRQKWFAKLQFQSLKIREDLFDDYYRDTAKITKENLIAFTKASTAYELNDGLHNCRARVRIIAGGREQKGIQRSVVNLSKAIPDSCFELLDGLYHGEYSINQPERYVKDLLDFCEPEENWDE